MELSDDGLQFLIDREGSVTSMYKDNAGHCTVGVGHLVHKGNCDYPTYKSQKGFKSEAPFLAGLSDVKVRDLSSEQEFFNPITSDRVKALLKSDKAGFEKAVNDNVSVSLTQTQFDALVSFSFNVGVSSFTSSTLLKFLNGGKSDQVPDEMKRWINSTTNGVKTINNGLVNRRAKEADLFTNGQY